MNVDSKGREIVAIAVVVIDGIPVMGALIEGPNGLELSEIRYPSGNVYDREGNRVYGPDGDDIVGMQIPGDQLN